jgi:hypothetical protein
MRYWWVNQNQTYRAEVRGSFMWSPKQNANGARNEFYENMREVSPGDVVFWFCDTRIKAIWSIDGEGPFRELFHCRAEDRRSQGADRAEPGPLDVARIRLSVRRDAYGRTSTHIVRSAFEFCVRTVSDPPKPGRTPSLAGDTPMHIVVAGSR